MGDESCKWKKKGIKKHEMVPINYPKVWAKFLLGLVDFDYGLV